MNHWFVCTISHVGWGNVRTNRRANAQFEETYNARDHSSSIKRLWVISPSPAGNTLRLSRIYILFNICQTFINYTLMKCSTVLGDAANEDIDFFLFFCFVTRLCWVLIPLPPSRSINYYYSYVRPPLTRCDMRITCCRWARGGTPNDLHL